MDCKHCTNGKINDYGDEWFAHFECKTSGGLYRERPRITKRNNRYFLHVDNSLSMIPIKACPICGRSFEVKEDIRGYHEQIENTIELPCKVGDKVYRTSGNDCREKIFEGVVNQINIYNNGEIRFWMYGHPLSFACDDIGKTVFLTKEEAKMKGGAD